MAEKMNDIANEILPSKAQSIHNLIESIQSSEEKSIDDIKIDHHKQT